MRIQIIQQTPDGVAYQRRIVMYFQDEDQWWKSMPLCGSIQRD